MRTGALSLAAVVLAALWAALVGYRHLDYGSPSALDRIEASLLDLRLQLRGPKTPPPGVAIVSIDDRTAARAGTYPLPRVMLADIIAAIAERQPAAIAVDMLLVDKGDPKADARVAAALGAAPAAIAAAGVFSGALSDADAQGPLAGVPIATELLMPNESFARQAAIGIVNVEADASGTPRHIPLILRAADRIDLALALKAAALATGSEPQLDGGSVIVGDRVIRTDAGYRLALSFYGPRGTIPTISAADLLAGQPAPTDLKGSIVLLGANVTGGGDVFHTPFDAVLPGVEVIATAVSNIMAGDNLVRDRTVRLADAASAIGLTVLLVGLLAWRRNAIGLALAAALVAAFVVLNQVALSSGLWLSLAVPLAAALPPALVFGSVQIWSGRRSASHFERQSSALQSVQAPGMSKWLAQDPDFLTVPKRMDAAIVFIDLSGFTGLSERLGPIGTRELLDGFYGRVEQEVTAAGGVITSFMGDGVMILFGLPEPAPGDALAAATCATRLCTATRSWLAGLAPDIAVAVGFKVGAHFGPVIVSRLGSGTNQQIAATGDTINVAARLMETAASEKAELAASMRLADGSGLRPFAAGTIRGPTEVSIRGRQESISVLLWTSA
jgi:adenylate cyclase